LVVRAFKKLLGDQKIANCLFLQRKNMPLYHPSEQDYSDEVQEIIGAAPSWLIRWGTSLFFITLFFIIVFSSLIKSPDIVPAKLKIDDENRPQEVLARTEGKLTKLFVEEQQQVRKGAILGYIESTANHEQVLALSSLIDSLHANMLQRNYDFADKIILSGGGHFGEMQPALDEFYLAYLQFLNFTSNGIFVKKEQAIRNEINSLKLLQEQLTAQHQLNWEEYALSEKELDTHRKLSEAKVISEQELRHQEREFLNSRLPLHITKSSLISNRIAQEQKLRELMEMEYVMKEQRSAFLAKIQKIKSELDNWKKKHVLVSERDGRIVFHRVVRANQWLELNKPVMYVADYPEEEQPFGELTLEQQSFGKIKEGQDVLIHLSAYPSQEFGLLRGKITYISRVMSGDSVYTAKVKLQKQTTYNRTIKMQIGLVALAEVITEEQSLLTRVLHSSKDILVNR
jgi:multidrug efflux pump subunit AcrA (membrane-fusion protein)